MFFVKDNLFSLFLCVIYFCYVIITEEQTNSPISNKYDMFVQLDNASKVLFYFN